MNWTDADLSVRDGRPPIAKGRLKPARAMNKNEAAYAAHLATEYRLGEILWWRFESIKLRISDSCFITVDFFVVTKDGELQCHDTKGTKMKRSTKGERYAVPYIEEDAIVKLRTVAEMFPFKVKAVYYSGDRWESKDF